LEIGVFAQPEPIFKICHPEGSEEPASRPPQKTRLVILIAVEGPAPNGTATPVQPFSPTNLTTTLAKLIPMLHFSQAARS
jgi:hypothetical protein